jgi:hypothetical protein
MDMKFLPRLRCGTHSWVLARHFKLTLYNNLAWICLCGYTLFTYCHCFYNFIHVPPLFLLPLVSKSLSYFSYVRKFWILVKQMTYVKHSQFLGAFAKLRKATIRFVMSVRPFFCPCGTTRLPLDRFPWKFIFECFWKLSRKAKFL